MTKPDLITLLSEKENLTEKLYIMTVTDLKGSGLHVPYDQLESNIIKEVKLRLMDTIIALIGGALSVPKDELESLLNTIDGDPKIRPVWPLGLQTSLEMAGFLNAYFIRNADWGDTYRRRVGVGGHPSDQIAAILALCDTPGVSGKQIIELIHLAYQLWAVLQENMLVSRPDLDYTTTLSLTIPVIAATCFGVSPQRVQNALNLSASSGVILEQIRRDMTNLKSAASSYAVARGLWWFRLSKAIQAPASIFDGEYGWYRVFAPLKGELAGLGFEGTYNPLEVKVFACCNANQGPVECAVRLHKQVRGKLEQIKRILIHVSDAEAKFIFKPGQARYPMCQSDADHNVRYCTATALQFGALTPFHFGEEYILNRITRRVVDLTEVSVLTTAEAADLGNQDGSCILEIYLDNGAMMSESLSRAVGVFAGLDTPEREMHFQEIIERKRRMIETAVGFDLTPLSEVVFELENHDGHTLLDRIQESLRV
jgi:2-methylcitrate dehydratase